MVPRYYQLTESGLVIFKQYQSVPSTFTYPGTVTVSIKPVIYPNGPNQYGAGHWTGQTSGGGYTGSAITTTGASSGGSLWGTPLEAYQEPMVKHIGENIITFPYLVAYLVNKSSPTESLFAIAHELEWAITRELAVEISHAAMVLKTLQGVQVLCDADIECARAVEHLVLHRMRILGISTFAEYAKRFVS